MRKTGEPLQRAVSAAQDGDIAAGKEDVTCDGPVPRASEAPASGTGEHVLKEVQ